MKGGGQHSDNCRSFREGRREHIRLSKKYENSLFSH